MYRCKQLEVAWSSSEVRGQVCGRGEAAGFLEHPLLPPQKTPAFSYGELVSVTTVITACVYIYVKMGSAA